MTTPTPPTDAAPQETEAAYWRARYEAERERLAKLWVAYKALDAELDALRPAEAKPAQAAPRAEPSA